MLSALGAAGVFACSSGLPSGTPLGGKDEPLYAKITPKDGGLTDGADAAPSASAGASPGPKPPPTPPPATVSATPDPPPALSASAASSAVASAKPPVAKAPGCDDSKANVPACNLQQPTGEKTCFMFVAVEMMCKEGAKVFKPKVAEKLVTCLNAGSGTAAMCKIETAVDCVKDSIALACPVKTAPANCKAIMDKCPAETGPLKTFWNRQMCGQVLSALTDANRKTIVACMKKKCSVQKCLGEIAGP